MKKIFVGLFIIMSAMAFGDKKKVLKAPEFLVRDQYEMSHNIKKYEGKVIFLNFWATWCPPCREEMPAIEELYKEYGENKRDVVFLGVNSEKKNKVEKFLKNEKYTFPTLFDINGEITNKYYINAFPTTFIINEKGEIYGRIIGAITKETMKQAIQSVLE